MDKTRFVRFAWSSALGSGNHQEKLRGQCLGFGQKMNRALRFHVFFIFLEGVQPFLVFYEHFTVLRWLADF